jgi:Sec-independent protein translocase protein TatA
MGQAVKEFQKAKDEFSDELHTAGKSETDVAKSDVKPAQSTLRGSKPTCHHGRRPDQAVTPQTKPTRFKRN